MEPTIRPVTPDDAPAERRFFAQLSPRARRLRFHSVAKALGEELIHFYTHVDHNRHEAFVCEHQGEIIGEARYVANPGSRSCEFGIVVADAWHHTGVAQRLLQRLIEAARANGFETLEGLVLSENRDMLDFVQPFGFEAQVAAQDAAKVRIVKRL